MTRNETFDNIIESPIKEGKALKKEKVLTQTELNHICLFCGKQKAKHWDDYTPYYECDCEDVRFNEQIAKEIKALEAKRRKPKFAIEQKPHLVAARD